MKAPWNSLEIVKLCAGLITPLVVAVVGVYIHHVTKRFELSQWRSQKLIEKRLAIYDSLAPDFNEVLCYFTYVGAWRDTDPATIVALKRSIDKRVYLAAPLFSREFFDACMAFQSACFATYTGWGRDASLRTHFERRREARPADWKTEWEGLFSTNPSTPSEVQGAYVRVMRSFATDVGVNDSFSIPSTGSPPRSVR